jgi:bifunctional UDP-N-acetylglucosamine pyrophosphorylase / glucosamine-1-phosphate N-acetyltransferase
MSKTSIRVLVAAAGRGSRAGLSYPKTLFPIHGHPILVRILRLLASYDTKPAVIVSPEGRGLVQSVLDARELSAELIVQQSPKGMGDAILCLESSLAEPTEHVLLIWGDIPFIQEQTVTNLVAQHLRDDNDLTFATRIVDQAYTVVRRDTNGQVIALEETRETGRALERGERDIGLFVFRRAPVLQCLKKDVPGKFGKHTGEHGFLYVVQQLVEQGFKVDAMPIATELDLVSLNSMSDIEPWLGKI